jgi:hypothetical protein
MRDGVRRKGEKNQTSEIDIDLWERKKIQEWKRRGIFKKNGKILVGRQYMKKGKSFAFQASRKYWRALTISEEGGISYESD